jgi:hypothetical protein
LLGRTFPESIKEGLVFGLFMGSIIFAARFFLKKRCYPIITIIDEEGIHIEPKNKDKKTVTWLQIVQISKITDMSFSWVVCKTAPQTDKPPLPKHICLTSTIYEIDTIVAILEMLRQHFINQVQAQ